MSFSSSKNKLWGGAGFIIKGTSLELSSLCFATQKVRLGLGKYNGKIIGSSISGNGVVLLQILKGVDEVFSKTIQFSSKINTEILFGLDLQSTEEYTIKLSRGKESIGRVLISLINMAKIIEKPEVKIVDIKNNLELKENNFFIIDFDSFDESELFGLLSGIKNKKNIIFLLKVTSSHFSKEKNSNIKLFFEWDDIFDFISLHSSVSILYFDKNIDVHLFRKYNINEKNISIIKNENVGYKNISGILF